MASYQIESMGYVNTTLKIVSAPPSQCGTHVQASRVDAIDQRKRIAVRKPEDFSNVHDP
jgi:hypothetical protein